MFCISEVDKVGMRVARLVPNIFSVIPSFNQFDRPELSLLENNEKSVLNTKHISLIKQMTQDKIPLILTQDNRSINVDFYFHLSA